MNNNSRLYRDSLAQSNYTFMFKSSCTINTTRNVDGMAQGSDGSFDLDDSTTGSPDTVDFNDIQGAPHIHHGYDYPIT